MAGVPWALLAAAVLTGAVFVRLGYGFTGGFRAFLEEGDARALGAAFIVPAVAAPVIIPVASLAEGYSRFLAPVGVSLLLGAAIFGVGMQLAGGCGSGTLVGVGRGSRRMLVALPFFCLGGLLGSLALPAALAWPGIGVVDLAERLGIWGGLAATELLLLAGAALVLRGQRPSARGLWAGAVVGLLAALLFLVGGQPWGVTLGLTLWGAKAVQAMGIGLHGFAFWSDPGMAEALAGPWLDLPASATDLGIILGALLAAAAGGRLGLSTPIGGRAVLEAAAGGLLMGIGARLSFGCNIGAFVGGASSGSLHGFVWVLAVLPGCKLGILLRQAGRGPARASPAAGSAAAPARVPE
ncbi:YeeE/YedE family protein [Rhodovarius crocodyli]|uniref:YeeE/YedE family protein n=1 Tax=Rhodovarius crocodyli TaxID=1979269 RepID=A0A437M3K4_9PROT|nr:YeeE/YedE thiosulfate transporter family protein [Rhodovarius crocodyli]RVT92123.1 YeeE/YedE family protein [Rhodovarius crocodyli]